MGNVGYLSGIPEGQPTFFYKVIGHDGEALAQRQAFPAASEFAQNALIEFLKRLQGLPPGTRHLMADEVLQSRQVVAVSDAVR